MERYSVDKIKEEYNEFYSKKDFIRFEKAERAFIRSLISKVGLKKGNKVLDLACGTGKYSGLMSNEGLNVTGVDLSEVGIEIASKRYPNANFIVADIRNLPFNRGEFDFVLCSGLSFFNEADLSLIKDDIQALVDLTKSGHHFVFLKTSSLTDKPSKSGGRIDYTVRSFSNFFRSLNGVEVINEGGTYPQAFQVIGRLAFSSAASLFSKLLIRLTGYPVRALVMVKKVDN